MADGINKTNNAVVAPDVGNMIKAFVQNETVQKVAHRPKYNPNLPISWPYNCGGFSEDACRYGTSFYIIMGDPIERAPSFVERMKSNAIRIMSTVEKLADSGRDAVERMDVLHGHAAVKRMAVLREEPAVGIQDIIIKAKPQATESIRRLSHRGFEPTGKEEVQALILGLINMFK